MLEPLFVCEYKTYTIPDLRAETIRRRGDHVLKEYYENVVLPLLRERYFMPHEEIEEQLFERVAQFIGKNEQEARVYYDLMRHRLFLPATPTLMNAGRERPMMSSCFVINPEDDMNSITDYWRTMAMVQKYGGGVGVDWSAIRPEGSRVAGTGGVASGFFPFFEVANAVNRAIKQGSVRSGANAATLRISHPEIMKFIDIKRENPAEFGLFNLSVTVTDEEFMRLLEGEHISLEFGGEKYGEIRGDEFLLHMAENAWRTGDPSFYFIDRVNHYWEMLGMPRRLDPEGRPYGRRVSHNPCGEQNLASHTSCNLASINLFAMIDPVTNEFHWELMRYVVKWAVRFLDGVIDKNWFPDDRIGRNVRHLRNIGLGFMGLADVFYLKGWEYGSPESIEFTEKVTAKLTEWAEEASRELAEEYGPAPALQQEPRIMLRNTDLTCIAPTGSISLLGFCSSGVEPWFYTEYEKLVYPKGTRTVEKYIKIKYPAALMFRRKMPKTATELSPRQHIDILAAVSRNVTNAVSKTINLPEETTVEEIIQLYDYGFRAGCKSFTVFRNNSRSDLAIKEIKSSETNTEYPENSSTDFVTEPRNVCPSCSQGILSIVNGCRKCGECGWEACSLG